MREMDLQKQLKKSFSAWDTDIIEDETQFHSSLPQFDYLLPPFMHPNNSNIRVLEIKSVYSKSPRQKVETTNIEIDVICQESRSSIVISNSKQVEASSLDRNGYEDYQLSDNYDKYDSSYIFSRPEDESNNSIFLEIQHHAVLGGDKLKRH